MLYELLRNLIGSLLLYYDLILHLPFLAHSSSSFCIDLPFMVDSIDSSAVWGTAALQVDEAQLTC